MARVLAGGNDGVDLLAKTIATGAILFVPITILSPISGAYFIRRSRSWLRYAANGLGSMLAPLAATVVSGVLYGAPARA